MTNLCVYIGLFLVFAAGGSAHLNLYLNQLEVMRLLGMLLRRPDGFEVWLGNAIHARFHPIGDSNGGATLGASS
ncbi:hypothetical protein RP20_CCG015498 [Aedes albopictus]|nr:hypothetical protein RP20_CCG015498 [Aedes albopictus]